MKSAVKHAFDGDVKVRLRNAADGAETSTVSETGVALDRLSVAYWDNGEIANGRFDAVVHVEAVDVADGDETYLLTFEVDSAVGFPSAIEVGRVLVAEVGAYTVPLDSDTIKKLDTDAAFIRVTSTIAGTTPSITYGAWMAPAAMA